MKKEKVIGALLVVSVLTLGFTNTVKQAVKKSFVEVKIDKKSQTSGTCVLEALEGSGIGDVKYSILDETEFQQVHGTEWVLLHGQPFANLDYGIGYSNEKISDYVTDTTKYNSIVNLPNAAGKFLRARNIPTTTSPYPNENPDGLLTLGTYQGDVLGSHVHGFPREFGGNSGGQLDAYDGGSATHVVTATTTAVGGNETRPRNITVNVFVKIRRGCINAAVQDQIVTNQQGVNAMHCGPSDRVNFPEGCLSLVEDSLTNQHDKVSCLKQGLEEWEGQYGAARYWTSGCLAQTVSMAKRVLIDLGTNKTTEEGDWYDYIVQQYPYYYVINSGVQ